MDDVCTALLRIGSRGSKEYDQSALARKIGVHRSSVGRHIPHLLSQGLIAVDDLRVCKIITFVRVRNRNTTEFAKPWAREERYKFKVPIVHVGSIPNRWGEWKRCTRWKGGMMLVGKYMGYTLQLYQGSRKSTLLLHVPAPRGYTLIPTTRYELELERVKEALNYLDKKYGWKFDYVNLDGTAEFAFAKDPYAQEMSQRVEVKQVGTIDRSLGKGELEYFTPEYARDYILLPLTVRKISDFLEGLSQHFTYTPSDRPMPGVG